MTEEEKEITQAGEGFEVVAVDPSFELIQDTLNTFLSTASVEAVYSTPVEKDDALIIPAAEVVAFMGFGAGVGSGGDDEGGGEGSGGGGGGRTFARPVAVIIANPEGVRVEPVVDVTKIALAAFTAGAFMFGMALRMLNPRKALDDLQEGKWG